MCGIAGYININSKPIKDTSLIDSMLKVQKHRGPDDSGIRAFSLNSGKTDELDFGKPRCINGSFEGILGFNRLSIMDLSINGHQPMMSPDGKVLLTLNGEIYNAFNYKNELKEWGYLFKSTSDTEVVLALYLRYGFEGMLTRLNGMFALVIVDLKKKRLYITRDRFGIKPMYYIITEKVFSFSSELKSFMFINHFNFKLDLEKLDEYLLFRNNIKGTLFENVQTLEPGYYITFNQNKNIIKKEYFNINDYVRSNKIMGDCEFYSDKLQHWLGKSVERQLMSDVKLGCQLSGGIDSSLVTWLANKNSKNGNFEAVSIIFSEQRYSEENYINKITQDLAIPSHKFLLDPEYYFYHFEKATWHLEFPINHPNTIGIYKLSQQAKNFVTVLLSGEGADEVFGGYDRFYNIVFPYESRKLLHEIKNNLKHPLQFLDYFDHEYRAVMATTFITPSMAKTLFSEFNKEKAISNRISFYKALSGSLFDKQVKYEIQSYLPDLLIRQDKMSMAHSIENRVPFLDNEVVENSFKIPEKLLLIRKSIETHNTEKYLLKKLTASAFGNEFAFRQKMGFGIPVRTYFQHKLFIEYLNDKVLPGILQRGLFNHSIISKWFSCIKNLKYEELQALWIIIAFEIWASIYLDNKYSNWNTLN